MPTPKTSLKPVAMLASCHTLGACLGQRGAPCRGKCRLDQATPGSGSSAPGFAPGVIDGPYLRRTSRTERLVHGLLVVILMAVAAVAALAQLAHVLGWL